MKIHGRSAGFGACKRQLETDLPWALWHVRAIASPVPVNGCVVYIASSLDALDGFFSSALPCPACGYPCGQAKIDVEWIEHSTTIGKLVSTTAQPNDVTSISCSGEIALALQQDVSHVRPGELDGATR